MRQCSNIELGRAVCSAVDELEYLGKLTSLCNLLSHYGSIMIGLIITTFDSLLVSSRPVTRHHHHHNRRPFRIHKTPIQTRVFCNKEPEQESFEDDSDEDILLLSEDWTVPGGSNDSLSSNTELGRAVRSAVDELEHLGKLEEEVLNKAFDLLDQLIKRPRSQTDGDEKAT